MANTSNVMRVAVAAGAAYAYHKRVPSVDEIGRFIPDMKPAVIAKNMAKDEFKDLMKMRGYDGFGEHTGGLTPQQIFTVGKVTDPTDRRPLAAKLKSVGITYAQYRAWLKNPAFMRYITQVGEDMLGEHIHDVHASLTNKATGGDIQAMKLFYEVSGRHDPNKQAIADLNNIIRMLLEIITRHVTDIGTVMKISQEIETVMSGGTLDSIDTFDPSKNIIQGEVTASPAVSQAQELTFEELS